MVQERSRMLQPISSFSTFKSLDATTVIQGCHYYLSSKPFSTICEAFFEVASFQMKLSRIIRGSMTVLRSIRDGATVLAPEIVELRQRLHQRPKIGLHLPRDTSDGSLGVGIALEHGPRN